MKIHVTEIVFSLVIKFKHQEILIFALYLFVQIKNCLVFVYMLKTDSQNPWKKLGLPLSLQRIREEYILKHALAFLRSVYGNGRSSEDTT